MTPFPIRKSFFSLLIPKSFAHDKLVHPDTYKLTVLLDRINSFQRYEELLLHFSKGHLIVNMGPALEQGNECNDL